MKQYIGTKIIKAKPMTRGDYNNYRGWQIPADENPADEGYIVEYSDGYVSWSPKEMFEEAYRETEAMSFGHAIEAMKSGRKVARKGWDENYLKMYSTEIDLETVAEAVHNAWWEEKKKQGVTHHPDMIPYSELSEDVKEYDRVTAKTTIEAFNYMTYPFVYITDGKSKEPWTPSQADMLAEDWVFAD